MNAKLSRPLRVYGRTVLVKNKDPEAALQVLNTVISREGLFTIYRRTRYHEKPFQTRFRVIVNQCTQIYDEDMNKKIKFLMRKNRVNAYPGYDDKV